jgi:proline racemase
VLITIPDYKQVVVDVSVGGSFYLVDERLNNVQLVQQNGPVIRRILRR